MLKIRHIFLMTTLLLCACSTEERVDNVDGDQPVDVTFSFSVSSVRQRAARMASDVTQADNNSYRGITDVRLIPFRVNGKVTSSDQPLLAAIGTGSEGGSFDKTTSTPRAYFYLYDDCWVRPGTASFLFYGKGAPVAGKTDKASNGSLIESFPGNLYPEDISFRPESMRNDNSAPADAVLLAGYLTNIAQTPGWSSSHNASLRTFFLDFTGQKDGDIILMAGSAANVRAHVNTLYKELSELTFSSGSTEATIRSTILSRISSYTELSSMTFDAGTSTVTSLGGTADGYPDNLGVPAGGAALRWDGTAFVPQTETTTLASVNNLSRFAYPADLRYFANSQIRTSNQDKRTQYYAPSSTWEQVLSNYELERSVVTSSTQAVALIDPIQYAVACLQLSLLKLSSSSLKDAEGDDIPVAEGTFPLTGIIVGAQHPVDFSFLPKQPQSDVDTRFAYDRDTRLNAGEYFALSTVSNQTQPITTLVLQSYDEEEVPIVLEFQNNGTKSFMSRTGVVYPGTKFYLVAKLKPDAVTATTPDYQRRVFTQDFTTTTTMKVVSFANSYNILPDLLSPRLEVGVEIVQDWIQADPITVILD